MSHNTSDNHVLQLNKAIGRRPNPNPNPGSLTVGVCAPVWCCLQVSQFDYMPPCQFVLPPVVARWVSLSLRPTCTISSLWANKISSTNPEVHDVSQCRQRRTEPRTTINNMHRKFTKVLTCDSRATHAVRQTENLTDHNRHTPVQKYYKKSTGGILSADSTWVDWSRCSRSTRLHNNSIESINFRV